MIGTSRMPRRNNPLLTLFLLFSLSLTALEGPSSSATAKLTAEELVAKHLESIGTAQEIGAVKTRIISGNSEVIFRTEPKGQAAGRAVLASEGPRNLLGMSFPSPVYPREQLGFNGKSFVAAYTTPGVRSSLGSFLMTHELIFKQGLMGGTLSTAWPLLDVTDRKPQLEYGGLKKVDGKLLHQLKYIARGGSALQIVLFFEDETFRHVRTEYERVIAASIGTRSQIDAKEREIRYKMVEEFSNFKTESGLSLPHTYKIALAIDGETGTSLIDWEINLTQFTFNERIDPNSFNIALALSSMTQSTGL